MLGDSAFRRPPTIMANVPQQLDIVFGGHWTRLVVDVGHNVPQQLCPASTNNCVQCPLTVHQQLCLVSTNNQVQSPPNSPTIVSNNYVQWPPKVHQQSCPMPHQQLCPTSTNSPLTITSNAHQQFQCSPILNKSLQLCSARGE